MIYRHPPKNFNPIFEIVSCYCIHQDEILLLHRQDQKSQGGKWGPPAGKIDLNDKNIKTAMTREIKEETGLVVNFDHLIILNKFYVRYPNKDFVYHTFKLPLSERPIILINSHEHQNYQWLTPAEALKLNLVADEDASIKLTFNL